MQDTFQIARDYAGATSIQCAQVGEVPAFSSSTNHMLDDMVRQFGLTDALEVKQVGCWNC